MERVQVLIDKLVQQKAAGESAAQLLYTVQLLQAELAQLQQLQQKEILSSRKVSVVMPANFSSSKKEESKVEVALPAEKAVEVKAATPEPIPAPEQKEEETFIQPIAKVEEVPAAPVIEEPYVATPAPIAAHQPYMPPVREAEPKTATQQKDLFGNEAYTLRRPAILQTEEKHEAPQATYKKEQEIIPPHPVTTPPPVEPQPFDAIAETPTLLQHLPPQPELPKEIHQLIAAEHPSLNDRLKEEKVELAHKLKETPIKDLRKAIGINDRFVFVSELFRGDEVMYERSIKTINSFHILQEAEYWMNRELKVKLGWNDNKDTVQHFYGLVRRRFS